MPHYRTISAYLIKPGVRARHVAWKGFRTQFIEIRRDNPMSSGHFLAAVAIWCICLSSVQYAVSSPQPSESDKKTNPSLSLAANILSPTPNQKPAAVSTDERAQALPGGPSGQLLPPGTMAPYRTYANSYTKGQCTWYVATRRQIPPRWGNAESWYYNAISSGWSVGTTPAIAAIAWTPDGAYGHVALVEKVSENGREVYISEMNYNGPWVRNSRWVPTNEFKYIY